MVVPKIQPLAHKRGYLVFWTILCSKISLFPSSNYLQVLSLSSSWRSLQYSSVCLQEHRQVAGSCTNKRFFLSEQFSQHGSQTLHRETDRGGEEEGERDYHSVQLPPKRKATLTLALRMLQFAFPFHSLARRCM